MPSPSMSTSRRSRAEGIERGGFHSDVRTHRMSDEIEARRAQCFGRREKVVRVIFEAVRPGCGQRAVTAPAQIERHDPAAGIGEPFGKIIEPARISGQARRTQNELAGRIAEVVRPDPSARKEQVEIAYRERLRLGHARRRRDVSSALAATR
jgi:hypothetical protein